MTTHRAVRGRLLTFLGDPAEVGAAASHRYTHDGWWSSRTGWSRPWARPVRCCPLCRRARRSITIRISSSCPGLIDTHIHYPQTQVIGSYGAQLLEWLQKYTFVEEQKFSDPAHAERVRDVLPRRAAAQRHHDRRGLLHGPAGIGRGVLRREPAAQHAHDRRQGDDGPGCARGPPGHAGDRLPRQQGAARPLARPGPAALRDHAALRAHLDRGAARGRGCPGARASRKPTCRPIWPRTCDEIATARRLYPQAEQLHRHLRPLRPAGTELAVRPLHPSGRGGAAAAVGHRLDRGVLPDLEPVHRQRPVRSGDAARSRPPGPGRRSPPTSAAGPAIRCCELRPRPTRCCSCGARTCRRSTRSTA